VQPAKGTEGRRVRSVVFERLGSKRQCLLVRTDRGEEVGIYGPKGDITLVGLQTLFQKSVSVEISSGCGSDEGETYFR